jgi:hypothetical protein
MSIIEIIINNKDKRKNIFILSNSFEILNSKNTQMLINNKNVPF